MEELVAYIDLNQIENCVRNMVALLQQKAAIIQWWDAMRDAENLLLDMMKQPDFIHCDSLQSTLITEYTKEVIQPLAPCYRMRSQKQQRGK